MDKSESRHQDSNMDSIAGRYAPGTGIYDIFLREFDQDFDQEPFLSKTTGQVVEINRCGRHQAHIRWHCMGPAATQASRLGKGKAKDKA